MHTSRHYRRLNQVRGHRVELLEVEAALLEVASRIRADACALPRCAHRPIDRRPSSPFVLRHPVPRARISPNSSADHMPSCLIRWSSPARIVAFVSPDALEPAQVMQGAARVLPDFMMPSAAYSLSRLPLLPNGKLGRQRLRLDSNHLAAPRTAAQPATLMDELSHGRGVITITRARRSSTHHAQRSRLRPRRGDLGRGAPPPDRLAAAVFRLPQLRWHQPSARDGSGAFVPPASPRQSSLSPRRPPSMRFHRWCRAAAPTFVSIAALNASCAAVTVAAITALAATVTAQPVAASS